jgi:hypothetical protein
MSLDDLKEITDQARERFNGAAFGDASGNQSNFDVYMAVRELYFERDKAAKSEA